MANLFQRIINTALGTNFGVAAPPTPTPAPTPEPPPPSPRALPKRVEFPIGPAQGPRFIGGPTFTPGPITHSLTLTGGAQNDGHGRDVPCRSATTGFTHSQWKKYLSY